MTKMGAQASERRDIPENSHTDVLDEVASSRQAWGMVLRACLSQNVAIGCAFGAFGVSVLALQERYGTGRAEASMGLALALLAMSLVSPAAGSMTLRFGLRRTMLFGLLLSMVGYLVLAFAANIEFVLAAYALCVGPGMALFGSLPASVLAGGWMPRSSGRAIGIANMPLLLALLPFIGYLLLNAYGLTGLYLALAALHVAVLPIIFGVQDPPAALGLSSDPNTRPKDQPSLPAGTLLGRPMFWLIVVGGGSLNAIGIIGLSHLIALNVERGIAPAYATGMVSIMGGASVLGSVLAGMISDRLGGPRTLALAAFLLAGSWTIILSFNLIIPLTMAMLVIGSCTASVQPTVSVIATRFFGAHALPRLLGYYVMFQLPFTFLFPPAAGALHDATRSYTSVIIAVIAWSCSVGLLYLIIGRLDARRTQGLAQAAVSEQVI